MPDDSNNEFIHQVWAQTDHWFACKCSKTWTCDEPTDGQKDVLVNQGIPLPSQLVWEHNGASNGKKNKKLQKESIFVMMWPWPLALDHEKLINSGHYHYHCVYQIWKRSNQWFLSYCVNHLCGGSPQHKTITPTPTSTHHHPHRLTI